jgi:hypothetical protein
MRFVNYRVRRKDGTEFVTKNYREATDFDNRIVETFFTESEYLTRRDVEKAREAKKRLWDSFKREMPEG